MKLDEIVESIIKEAKIYDFDKYKTKEDVEFLKNFYNELADVEEEFVKSVSKNEQTSKILFLIKSTLNEVKSYIEKNKED